MVEIKVSDTYKSEVILGLVIEYRIGDSEGSIHLYQNPNGKAIISVTHPDTVVVLRGTDISEDEAEECANPDVEDVDDCRYCGQAIWLQNGVWRETMKPGQASGWATVCRKRRGTQPHAPLFTPRGGDDSSQCRDDDETHPETRPDHATCTYCDRPIWLQDGVWRDVIAGHLGHFCPNRPYGTAPHVPEGAR